MITFDKSPLFDGELGERLYQKVSNFIDKHSMKEPIEKGVLVGFSGGPDSVFLLEFLTEYKKRTEGNFKILAVHVNHSIRGVEADFDEELSRNYAQKLDVEFISRKVDAASYAKENHESLEEAARNLRYNVFFEIIQGRNDISIIATAHNSGDNFETVLFNMMRGAGLRGVSGIAPKRDNIIRPILSLNKPEIIKLLDGKNVKYAYDSTNSSTEYTRNYIRHELIPKFSRLSNNPDDMVTRLSESLRKDNEFIEMQAREFYRENVLLGKIAAKQLVELHPAIKSRVISYLAESCGISLERVHISQIEDLLSENNFKISLPKGYEFICEAGECYIDFPSENKEFSYKLELGENVFEDFDDIIVLSRNKIDNSFSNVYKISIQASFIFDIMESELCVRSKKDGDSYRYGGMTRKLKKLFNDKSIPPSRRPDVPVFCDKEGIVWVPGFNVRDDAKGNLLYVAICTPREKPFQKKRNFYIF